MQHIWYKVDVEEKNVLKLEGIERVLKLLGVNLSTEQVINLMNDKFGVDPHEKEPRKRTTHINDFVRYQAAKAPTATFSTAIFFMQTIGLICKGDSKESF